jgi:hypothetical protein
MVTTRNDEMQARRPETNVTAVFDPAAAMNGLEPLFQAGNRLLESWIAMGSEILEFSKAQFDRNLEVSKALAQAGSVDRAVDLQVDHARSTMREYASEASKLADLGTRAMLESLSSWQPAPRSESGQHKTAAE